MNIKEAADYLGSSVKTLERKIAAGDVSVAYVPGATGKQRTFDRAELDRFKAAEAEKAVATSYVISKSRNSDAPSSQALQRAGGEQGIAMFVSMLTDALRDAQAHEQGKHDAPPPVELKDKLMLNEREAAAYAGLSLADIERARASVKAIKTGAGWRVKRTALEAYVKRL
jgi:excisionase family DNA binding protein